MRQLVCDTNAATSLEVGLAYGVSALFICDGLAQTGGRRHIAIDPWQTEAYHGIGLSNLRTAGYDSLVEFHAAPSYRVLPLLQASGCIIEFAFVDGFHTFDFALVDFFYIDRMLSVGGIIAFDDAHWPSIHRLCRYIVTNRAYSVFGDLHEPQPRATTTVQKSRLGHAAIGRRLKRSLDAWYPQTELKQRLPNASRCIALRKEADDDRRWDFHRDF